MHRAHTSGFCSALEQWPHSVELLLTLSAAASMCISNLRSLKKTQRFLWQAAWHLSPCSILSPSLRHPRDRQGCRRAGAVSSQSLNRRPSSRKQEGAQRMSTPTPASVGARVQSAAATIESPQVLHQSRCCSNRRSCHHTLPPPSRRCSSMLCCRESRFARYLSC